MSQPIKTPLEPSFIARVAAGVRFAITGNDSGGWFSPGQPLQPVAQDVPGAKGRAWDFPVAINMGLRPRQEENNSFATLRALADNYDLLRLVIETRKDQMCRLAFSIAPRDEKAKPDARCEAAQDMLRYPDGFNDWQAWLRMVLEDMLVIDAATIYPRPTRGGGLFSLEPVDGATIRRVLDNTGRTPLAPEPAYQQVIKGLPAVNYSADELIYRPRNPRTNRIYGFSPVEQIVTTVNIALRRQLHQLQYYTEGSTPDFIMELPADWNPDQIKMFKLWWDSVLEGNTAARRGTMFVPAGAKPIDTKAAALKDEYDEWLARVVCYAFGITPQAFVKQMNRATADTAKDIASEEGLAPVMQWVKTLIDFILAKYLNAPDLQLTWDDERDHDPLQQAQINKIYVDAKVLHPDEVRADLGKEPLTDEQKEDMKPAPPPQLAGPDDEGVPPKPGAKPGAKDDDEGATLASKIRKAQKKSLYSAKPSTVTARAS